MADVRVLELTGAAGAAAAPQLSFQEVTLEALARWPVRPVAAPRLRVFEFTPRQNLHLDWASIQRLRKKAWRLIDTGVIADRLRLRDVVILEVSGAPRELRSSIDALRAQEHIDAPMMVLDVTMPEAPNPPIDIQAWLDSLETLLADEPLPKRRIERPPPQSVPAETASQTILETLLSDGERFHDSEAVGRALSGNPNHTNPKMVTSRARKREEIFGVRDGNAFRYPAFQFDAAGQPLPNIPALIEVLPRDADGSGRDAALWLFAPDSALGGRTPAEVFPADTARVIELANQRRAGGDA